MMDLPPTDMSNPTIKETQKMDQKEILIQRIKNICEISIKFSPEELKKCAGNYGYDHIARALFVDICNTQNYGILFQQKSASFLLVTCGDNLVPQTIGIGPVLAYHIEPSDIWALEDIIRSEGVGINGIHAGIFEEYPDAIRVVYTIMADNPGITPEFTTFTFGGTMADMPPLRDKDGNPNMDFFRAWKQKTEAYYSRK